MHAETEQLLTVTVGAHDYGIPISRVRRIAQGLRVVRVPGADAGTVGVVHLGGELIAAFDVAALLTGEAHQGLPVHVLVDVGGETVDLLVSSVGAMRGGPVASRFDSSQTESLAELALLDIGALIRDARTVSESA